MDEMANAPRLPLKAVIYATDFSPSSENAGQYAALLARRLDADLVAAHAFLLSQAAMEAEDEFNPPQKSAQRKEMEAALEEVTRRLEEGVKRTVPVLLEGDPREKIPLLAKEYAPALIVLGTQGRGRIGRSLVGSTAENILRAASGPSLTVGPHVPVLDAGAEPFRRVLYATDLSVSAAHAGAHAMAMAQAFHACIDVLHVIHPEDVEDPVRYEAIKERFSTVLKTVVPGHAVELCNPKAILEVGSAHHRILEHIREFEVDLLVLSIHKSSHIWLQSRLSGAFHIVANAPCPVMTIAG
jgi:nucleotide-binding universal stress UspA family protein